MPSPLARGKTALGRVRSTSPLVDHLVRMQQHYGRVNAGSQAGAVTYFAFLSFFPLVALAFVAVGYVARYFPDAQSNLVEAIEQVFPGLIGSGPGQITLKSIQQAAATIGIIGVATLIYAGLGWLSGMRTALQVVFELPARPPAHLPPRQAARPADTGGGREHPLRERGGVGGPDAVLHLGARPRGPRTTISRGRWSSWRSWSR